MTCILCYVYTKNRSIDSVTMEKVDLHQHHTMGYEAYTTDTVSPIPAIFVGSQE